MVTKTKSGRVFSSDEDCDITTVGGLIKVLRQFGSDKKIQYRWVTDPEIVNDMSEDVLKIVSIEDASKLMENSGANEK